VKRLGLLVSFILGSAMLVTAFGIGWANWWEPINRTVVIQTLMGALAVVVVFLAVMAIVGKGKERWKALTLDAILLLGFSALVFFSVGWLIAPVALALLGFSLWRLLRRQTERRAC
jgi:cation transport ATPase